MNTTATKAATFYCKVTTEDCGKEKNSAAHIGVTEVVKQSILQLPNKDRITKVCATFLQFSHNYLV
jgi:hypothetical protein